MKSSASRVSLPAPSLYWRLLLRAFLCAAIALCAVAGARAQELINNGTFTNGLTGWTQTSWAGGSSFGTNANGPTDTSASSGDYAYAGGGAYNLLQQSISSVTNGGIYRLTFLAGSKSGQGSAYGLLSLFDGLAGNYNSASFDYRPTDAVFGTYTVDFVARGPTDLWLRSDGGTYIAYDNVSVTAIGALANALNYSAASGYTEISSVLSGTGKVTANAGAGGLTLTAANTYSGGTEVLGGTLFVTGSGTLGASAGSVTVSNAVLDIRNAQTRTGTLTIMANGFVKTGDGSGSLVNNGSAFEFQGGSIELPLSGTGGMNITGGGRITSSNSYSGATTISATPGWYGTHTFFLNNANGLGDASAALTISGGTVSLVNNTLTRSGNLTISGGRVHTGTISKSGSNYDLQGGQVDAVLAGTAGLTKSGVGNASLTATNTYSGGTIINAGTLVITTGSALGDAAGAVTVNSGGTLYTGGGLTVSRTGNFTINGGSLTTDNNNFGTISVTGGGNIIASNAAVLAVPLAGTAGLTVGGAGETYLWAPSTYTGATTINSGQLTLGGSGAIATNSALSIASGAAVNVTGAYAPGDINRTFGGLTGAGVLYGGSGTVTINKTSGTDIFTGDIQGAQGLIKTGAGDLALGGASTYTGTTTINGGRIAVAHGSALGSTAAGTVVASGAQLLLTNVTVGNEALTINGAGLASGSTTAGALRSLGTNTYQGKVTLGSDARIFGGSGTSLTLDVASGEALDLGAFTLTIDGAGNNQVDDSIVGTGVLLKTGSGTMALAASGSYSGGTTLSNGVLRLNHAGAAGSGTITQASGSSTLQINATGTVANQMSIFNVRTMQSVTLSGNKTLNNATYTVDAGTTTTESGVLSGSGGITKDGTGTLIVTASNSFTGNTIVNAGVLNLNSATGAALGASSNVTVSATLLISQSGQVSNSAAVTLSGGTIQRGSGVSEVFGNLNLTGASFLDFGTGATGNLTFGTYTPSSLLTVQNFLPGNSLVFASNLTDDINNTGLFSFQGDFSSSWNGSTFTITAIPEPSTVLAAIGLLGLMLWPMRCRILSRACEIARNVC